MKFRILPFVLLGFTLWTCNLIEGKPSDKPSKKMTYSYACLDSAISGNKVNRTISKTTDILRNIAVNEDQVTDEVQNQYGTAFHKDAIETKTFVLLNDPVITTQLQAILDDLLRVRENPSKIKYSIYLIDDKAVNAFTFGGYIYVTKGMYDKVQGKIPLLYSIIGHEIGHSEKGHIKKTIQAMMASNKIFGEENGMTFFQIEKLLTASFNQVNELEADYYGTDLTYRLNHEVCSAVEFWTEMSKGENQYNKIEDFFRTHPFSALRAQCLKDHIAQNFGTSCTK
ncbi:MAG TPA: M48 family metallopeptidase [Flavisolibacter sp.]|nr:M48 family metallopeptidase [Flavisolibacter sp.]